MAGFGSSYPWDEGNHEKRADAMKKGGSKAALPRDTGSASGERLTRVGVGVKRGRLADVEGAAGGHGWVFERV